MRASLSPDAGADPAVVESGQEPRRRRSKQERRRVVEEMLLPGASVARVARAHGVNANQVFHWRRLYHQGLLDDIPSNDLLLPVRISDAEVRVDPAPPQARRQRRAANGAIHLKLDRGQLRLEGRVDPVALRVVLECLLR
ncbi:MAG: transposase [Bryobacteraceae bacterium]|nr:transposase [Bryobacteraceae bacterium]